MIRPATSADAPAIAALWNWMITDTLLTFTSEAKSDRAVEDIIRERAGHFFVHDTGAGVAGFATFGSFRAGPGYLKTCEHSVIVSPSHRARGIGRALLQHLLDVATDSGVHVMVAAISSENPPAVAFHESLGFEQAGRMPEVGFKNGRFLDLILMQKILNCVAS